MTYVAVCSRPLCTKMPSTTLALASYTFSMLLMLPMFPMLLLDNVFSCGVDLASISVRSGWGTLTLDGPGCCSISMSIGGACCSGPGGEDARRNSSGSMEGDWWGHHC